MNSPAARPYVGRFAPSPTGQLHFGSLVAAVGSYLDARAAGGRWLVRIEDIDPPREVAGSADAILRALETFELRWDGVVLYQGHRLPVFEQTVAGLVDAGLAYRCRCTRKTVAAMPGGIYDGRCRNAGVDAGDDHAVRLITHDRPTAFTDELQGRHAQRLQSEVGDFVIRRRDGLPAYQLAVTVDDDFQQVSDVVRGFDLIDSTPRQIHLREVLGLGVPRFAHLPVILDTAGEKLSKTAGSAALNRSDPSRDLHDALRVLRQAPPAALRAAPPAEQLDWAVAHWQKKPLRGFAAVRLDARRRMLRSKHADVALPHGRS